MRHRWALIVWVLALSWSVPHASVAQGTPPDRGKKTGMGLEQNFPNPVDSSTRIPFTVSEVGCADQSRLHKVSLRIYDIFSKLVAVTILQNGNGGSTGGDALENFSLTCNKYTAYWDGKSKKTSQRVPSGVYWYRLEVDGKVLTKRLTMK